MYVAGDVIVVLLLSVICGCFIVVLSLTCMYMCVCVCVCVCVCAAYIVSSPECQPKVAQPREEREQKPELTGAQCPLHVSAEKL